jgi:hypothetical protein
MSLFNTLILAFKTSLLLSLLYIYINKTNYEYFYVNNFMVAIKHISFLVFYFEI